MFRIRIAAAVTAFTAATLVPAAPASALSAWEDHATTWTNDKATAPKVLDLRHAAHANFDRVVIDIGGYLPGGSARYRKHFHYDASGEPVPIQGKSGVAVSLTPAYAHDDAGNDVYDGPAVARPHLETLRALAFTGDYEGYVSFAFALTHRAEYRVFRLHDPQRLVIDFRHER
jgi:hypothetical protein